MFTVLDLMSWRHARELKFPTGHKIELVPDWICEILSPVCALWRAVALVG